MFRYVLLTGTVLAAAVFAITASDALAQDTPGASTGVINTPAADEMPGVEEVSPPPTPTPDEPGIDAPVEQPAEAGETDNVTAPRPIRPAATAVPPAPPTRTVTVGEMPDEDTDDEQPTSTVKAPPSPAPGPQLDPPATTRGDVPLWKPGTAGETSPTAAPADDEDGQARKVLLLVDRSASMSGYWAWTRSDAVSLIRNMDEDSSFHLVLFGQSDDVWQLEGDAIQPATLERKIQAIELLTFTTPAGDTDPQAGFDKAIAAIGDGPATIHFISDGVFNHPHRVRRDIQRMLAGKQIVVNTHLYGDGYPAAVSAMKDLAGDNGGEYVHATRYP